MTPNDVSQLVEALCEGNSNAYHSLIEADSSVISWLMREFKCREHGADRACILEVIWQHRDKAAIPFLASALRDPDACVWKQAIDGLVAIGGSESLNVLLAFRREIAAEKGRVAWVDEAISQIHT